MNKKLLIEIGIVVLVGILVVFAANPNRTKPNTEQSAQDAQASFPISIEAIKNASYKLQNGEMHKVTNGRYDFSFEQGKEGAVSPEQGSLVIDTEHIAVGDVDYGWENIAIVPTIETYGGSGGYVSLQVLQGPEARFISSLNFGDRTEIRSIEIKKHVEGPRNPGSSIRIDYKAQSPLPYQLPLEGPITLVIGSKGDLYQYEPAD